ncbi:cardiolipin synthase [Pasteurella langaaensis]|uniref:cardiolipin synthase n=1 Tax=Alitibacter langaaensis TaxID=756 RepID=UPI000E303639|nr:cardiolipin synthase [Pasteurella langaaensis]
MDFEHIVAYALPIVMWALIVSITLRQLTKRQSSTAMLSWLMIIYLVPVAGIFAYLIFGEINLGKRRVKAFKLLQPKYAQWFQQIKQQKNVIDSDRTLLSAPLFDLAQNRLSIPCMQGNELHILDTPESIIKSIVEDIQRAKTSINMVFYIWADSGLVNEVMTALIDARRRGVNVHILLDYVGSRHFFNSENCRYMRENGIEIAEALHVQLFRVFLRRIDLRQHRKIIVIDNEIAYTGSMNMVDPKFFKQDSNVGEWVDVMVRINGPVSSVLNGLHALDWELETEQKLPLSLPVPNDNLYPLHTANRHTVQILATGPGYPEDLVQQALSTAIFSARESIFITSPYFVPSQNITDALVTAALRGVNVTLILPRKNDSLMVGWASRTYFDELLAAGVNIHLFDRGLLHTKSVLIDNKLALVGTVNMDMRSFLLNYEVTMVVEDEEFANEVSLLHENYQQGSVKLDYQRWVKRPMYKRIIEKLFFLFSPLL